MEVRCAWCPQNHPGESDVMQPGRTVLDEFGNEYPPMVSHSICPRCLVILRQQITHIVHAA
jgi:hypothetical protein